MPDLAALRIMAGDVRNILEKLADFLFSALRTIGVYLGISYTIFIAIPAPEFQQRILISTLLGAFILYLCFVVYEELEDWYEDARERAHAGGGDDSDV